jgi:hypothetical protein
VIGSEVSKSCAAGSPAKTYLLPASVAGLLANEAAYGMSSRELSRSLCPDGSLSKTSPVCFRRNAGETWGPSSGRWLSWGMASRGGCLMLKGSEFPNNAAASSLSEIVIRSNVPEKYCLSAKACAGILRRADKSGKTLPPMFRNALQEVAMPAKTEAGVEHL